MKPRLLVIELHHLGDAVMAIPFLKAASASYEVSVFCRAPVADMLGSFVPEVSLVVAAEGWAGRFRQAAGELKRLGPAVTVCAWSDARAEVVAWLTGAEKRVGLPMTNLNFYASNQKWRKRRLWVGRGIEGVSQIFGIKFLTDFLNRDSERESHLRNWERVAERLGMGLQTEEPWISVPVRGEKGLWVVHPGGRLATKRWPVDRFQELLKEIFAAKGWPVLIIDVPGEGSLEPVGPLQRRVTCATHVELAAALASAESVLCNDSYPAHLAAALGKKVFTIFGSGEPAWFSPFGNADRVIQKDVCPHHPCVDRCVMPSVVCLEAVTVRQVAELLERG
ncbi:N/A [soil metagenome]